MRVLQRLREEPMEPPRSPEAESERTAPLQPSSDAVDVADADSDMRMLEDSDEPSDELSRQDRVDTVREAR